MSDPIAYTYEASEHCPNCAAARFGRDERGFIAENSFDADSNPVGAIFEPFDDRDMVCGTCSGVIHEIETDDDEIDDDESGDASLVPATPETWPKGWDHAPQGA